MENYTLTTIDFKIFGADLHMQMPDCWFTYLCVGFVIFSIGIVLLSLAFYIFDKTNLAKNYYTKKSDHKHNNLSLNINNG